MVTVVLEIECIRFKLLETINYNKDDPVI